MEETSEQSFLSDPVPFSEPEPAQPAAPEAVSAPASYTPLYLAGALAVAFAVGLLLGFVGRPLVIKDIPVQVVVTVVPNPEAVAQAPVSTPAAPAAQPEPNNPTTPTPTIMDFVLADARHFQGDQAAPVTIVEFSDFK